MRWLLIGVLLLALTLSACGTVVTTATDTSSYTPQEEAMIAFCEQHIEQLEALVTDTNKVLDDPPSLDFVVGAMQPISDSYGQLCDEYNASNGGEPAGGKVAKLEMLWEECGNAIRDADLAILQCITDPDNVDIAQAGIDLATAQQDIKLIRAELNRLEGN